MVQRLSLKQMIMNEIDKHPRGYAATLAKVSGYGDNSGNLNRILKDEKKEFDKFQGLIDMVIYIWGHDAIQKMVGYSTEVDPNKKTARFLLEYLSTNRQFEAFNRLLDRMDGCTNKESKEWAKVYRLQYKYEISHNTHEYDELLNELKALYTNVFELNIYIDLLMNYCFNQKSDYTMTKFLAKKIEKNIESIENEYIKEMYKIRLNEVMSYNYLRVFNNTDSARKCADAIIESHAGKGFKAYAYFIKGYSFLFTSYEKTVKYLNESIEIYKELNRMNDVEDLKEKIEFASIYWGKFDNVECKYIKNYLLLHLKNGTDITNCLKHAKEKIDPAFYLYLDGCLTKSNKLLILSLIKYKKKNDSFLANLAKIELLKNGYDEEVLEELISIGLD